MRNKGFTLIELLAVIVILAIIALIATPIILNIINDTRISANERSAEMYIDAVEQAVLRKNLSGTFNPTQCTIENSVVTCGGEELKVEVDGEKPITGTIIFEDGLIKPGTTLNFNNFTATLNEDRKVEIKGSTEGETPEKPIEVGKFNSVCSPAEGTMNMTAGTKYNCKVDPNKDPYTFYILTAPEDGATTVNLIMDSNITADGNAIKDANPTDKGLVAWINNSHFLEMGGSQTDWDNENMNIYGPITAMNHLESATSTWTNLEKMTVSTFTDKSGATHNIGKTYTTYARLPYYSEIMATGCERWTYGTCPNWMVDYLEAATSYYPNVTAVSGVLGYWTLSADTSFSFYSAVCVDNYGEVKDSYASRDVTGVRPVITLSI